MSKIIIVGGGIIGLSSAYYLHKAGHEITILDKGHLTDNCSSGNAGMIVPSHFTPLAAPGMIRQGIRWMFNSKSPFYVKPSLNLDLLSWGIKFIKHANAKHVAASAIPLRDISLLSRKLYEELAESTGINFGLTDNGILAFYKTEQAATEEAHLAEKGKELGLDMAVLNLEECKKLQPGLNLDVLGAVHYRCDAHISPDILIKGLTKYLEDSGVTIMCHHDVTRIERSGQRVTRIFTGDKKWSADQFVIAGGSWSPEVAKMAGIKVPLIPGKGYSFMEPEPEKRMTIPALLAEARVAITPMNGHIRYGGTMEIGKANTNINMNRVKGIVESVPLYFPDLKPAIPAKKDIWFGFRPASPDGLPYIGRSTMYSNLIIATGHGMMGLSLGPATGYLVNEIISEKPTSMDIAVFSPNRYQ